MEVEGAWNLGGMGMLTCMSAGMGMLVCMLMLVVVLVWIVLPVWVVMGVMVVVVVTVVVQEVLVDIDSAGAISGLSSGNFVVVMVMEDLELVL